MLDLHVFYLKCSGKEYEKKIEEIFSAGSNFAHCGLKHWEGNIQK
jgi:hypothetical protein